MSGSAEAVSSDQEELLLVDSNDEIIGNMTKFDCHQGDGVLHRAFSVFIFNHQGDVLLQQRSEQKMLWPGYWSNACCSHPRAGESSEEAVHRRLQQELGISADLTYLYKFEYQAKFDTIGSEHELCWVWLGITDDVSIKANPNEIADWRYFHQAELNDELNTNSALYTPWMKMEWQTIIEDYTHLVPHQGSQQQEETS